MKTNRTFTQYKKIPLFLLSEILKENYGVEDSGSVETIKQYLNGKSIPVVETIESKYSQLQSDNRMKK